MAADPWKEIEAKLGDEEKLRALLTVMDNLPAVADSVVFTRVILERLSPGGTEKLATDAEAAWRLTQRFLTPEMDEFAGKMEKMLPSLLPLMDRLEALAKGGTLGMALDLLVLVKAFLDSLTPTMVEKLAHLGSEGLAILERTVEYQAGELLDRVYHEIETDAAKVKERKPPGLLGLAWELRDPQVQAGLGLLLAVLKDLPRLVEPTGD